MPPKKTVPQSQDTARSGDMGSVDGAQSIQRALRILRHIASLPNGTRLREITAYSGLNKATCHRILSALVSEDFLRFDRATFRYQLGLETVLIGWTARARQDMRELAQRSMEHICQATGDTVFLSLRSGMEAVCIDRHVGDFPIKTLTLEVGNRRPLGVGAGSMALLAFLPSNEIESILEAIEPRLGDYEALSIDFIRTLAQQTKERGYSFNDGYIIPAMSAVGVPVLASDGSPIAALSVAAIASRMDEERSLKIIALLQEEAGHLSRILRSGDVSGEFPSSRSGNRGLERRSPSPPA